MYRMYRRGGVEKAAADHLLGVSRGRGARQGGVVHTQGCPWQQQHQQFHHHQQQQ
jgi:hypothetical protein